MFHVKICGVTTAADARMAAAAGADAIGLNFVPGSPRCLAADVAREIVAALPDDMLVVGVFAGADPSDIRRIVEQVGLDAVQLHGHLALPQRLKCSRRHPLLALALGEVGLEAPESRLGFHQLRLQCFYLFLI